MAGAGVSPRNRRFYRNPQGSLCCMRPIGLSRGRWGLTLYPDAAEAGGCFQPAVRPVATGGPPNPERAAEEAGRRARAKVRRYCTANRLNRFATLTYARACHDPHELREHVAEFFKGIRRELGGRALPYLWAPEWHPGGHGLHVHFAVNRYVRQSLIRDVWGHGHVFIKLLSNLPVGSGPLAEARLAAGYLAKYVSKSFDRERSQGLHRYEVAQGFQPETVPYYGASADDVIGRASQFMGCVPSAVWRSSSVDGWRGPPAYWVVWSD